MKRKFTESQILATLKKQESGIAVKEICRELEISDATFYNWKAKYGGIEISEVKRNKDLQADYSRLQKMYAELSMEHHALKEWNHKRILHVPLRLYS